MNKKRFAEVFRTEDEHGEFERVENKLSNRADLHAFLLLDKLVPGDRDIVSDAMHDEIFLDTDTLELTKVISESQIIDLIRCCVMFDEDEEYLHMFA